MKDEIPWEGATRRDVAGLAPVRRGRGAPARSAAALQAGSAPPARFKKCVKRKQGYALDSWEGRTHP